MCGELCEFEATRAHPHIALGEVEGVTVNLEVPLVDSQEAAVLQMGLWS